MILSGDDIRARGIFTPFHERTKVNGMTFGLGPAGYDVRIDQSIILEPHGFALASTVEHFTMPTDLLGVVHDKSTLARIGLSMFNTVIEPGWSGYLTLELSNETDVNIEIPEGSPIAQVIFHVLSSPASVAYSGRYQNQPRGPQPAKFFDDDYEGPI